MTVEVPATYYTQVTDPTRVELPVTVDAGSGSSVLGATLTVDASEVRGKVRLYAKRNCTEGAVYVFTCRLTSSHQRYRLYDLVVLGADKAAEPGAHGTVRFSFTGPDGRRAEARTVMTAGTPKLWGKKLSIEDAPAGKPVEIWGGVLNRGPIAASGFGVTVTSSRMVLDRRYGNCRYAESGPSRAYCFFDTRVEPGEAYAFDAPFVVEGGEELTKTSVSMSIFAPGQDAGPYFNEDEYTVPGTGPRLGLKPTEPKGFAQLSGHIPIDTDQRVDVQAVAGDLRGTPGDVVRLEVGLRNTGPGRIDARYFRYEIVPPEGITLIPPEKPSPDPEADESPYWVCSPWEPGEERYVCGGKGLGPGASETQVLRFRIDERSTGTGHVKVVFKGGYAERDSDKGNNVAKITVKVTGAGDGEDRSTDGRSGGLGWSLVAGTGLLGVLALAAVVPYGVRRFHRRG
ncbi:hypothetical protein ACFS5L_41345 [Streptomyces phyllanthi]|uniref:DUF11 domain-containing protein n=1 Tax=Streptomyces phyllanthi TaxID=1803180 RepID=A0A5N8VYT4_9ACTN|nr:hypothetical protein [Streptomyces phyllanthi]MPY39846.1 hypothetical protein [Streptomyces phyllanthi]